MAGFQKFTIAGLGEVLWDIYGSQKFLGGAPANFALHVQKLGHEGLVLSKVGDDPNGHELLQLLENRGIKIDTIQIDRQKPTGTVFIELDEKGVPRFTCSNDVAFDYLEEFSGLIADHKIDAVLFGTLAQRNSVSRQAIQNFVQTGHADVVIFDANLRASDDKTRDIVQFSLRHCNVLKLNDSEAKFLPQLLQAEFNNEIDFFHRLFEKLPNLDLICLTLGENGALAVTPKKTLYSPGLRISAIDTTGSGDAFIAGFASSFLQKKSLKECLEFANSLGALVATRKGAVPDYQIFEVEELQKNVRQRNFNSKFEEFFK